MNLCANFQTYYYGGTKEWFLEGERLNLSVSVVIPSFNMSEYVYENIKTLHKAFNRAGIDNFEIIIVDDGSDYLQNAFLDKAINNFAKCRLIKQENMGRAVARYTGAKHAKYEWLLLIDARVLIDINSLINIDVLLSNIDACVSHVNILKSSKLIGYYWYAIERMAWSYYFYKPRRLILNKKNFEFVPKGTTCTLIKKDIFIRSSEYYHLNDPISKNLNDDTLLLRKIALSDRLIIDPQFRAEYIPRQNILSFAKHAISRGVAFYSGHIEKYSIWAFLLIFFWFHFFLLITQWRLITIMAYILVFLISLFCIVLCPKVGKPVASFVIYSPLFFLCHLIGIVKAMIKKMLK